MSFLSSLSQWLVATLEPYGAPGLMAIAICDSSFLSLPEVNDAALMALSINNPVRMWELAAMTVLGSVLGCSLLYAIGRRGGEALLHRRFAKDRVLKVRGWYQRYGMLAVIVPSLLPPPLPFKIFVLSAGAFQISWPRFIAAVAIGRSIRYFAEGILAVWYGKKAIQIVSENFASASLALATLIVIGALVYIYGRRRKAGVHVFLLPVLLLCLGTGCVRNRTVPVSQRMFTPFPFDRDQALEKLESMSRMIQTFQAPIRLEGSTASLTEQFKRPTSPTMNGTLIMKRPSSIFLKGSLLVSIFEMVSDGHKYQVYVNQKNQLYDGLEDGPPSKPFTHLGELANQFVNVRPRQIQEALMPDILPLLNNPAIQALTYQQRLQQDRRPYFVVDFVDFSRQTAPKLVQELWFDLSTEYVDLARRQTFNDAGDIETDTQYAEYAPVGLSLRYPTDIDIHFLSTDTLIRIFVDPKSATLNGDVPEEAFEFQTHPGAQVFTFVPRDLVTEQR